MNNTLVRNASRLVPLKFGKLVTTMYKTQHLNAEVADKTKDLFEYYINSDVSKFAEEFSAFDIRNDRLHMFFRKWLHQNSNYLALWKYNLLFHSQS